MIERLNIREFRANFSRLTEPVEVLRGTETVGFWYPGQTPPMAKGVVAKDSWRDEPVDLIPGKMPSEKRAPAQMERFSTKGFTPVPKK